MLAKSIFATAALAVTASAAVAAPVDPGFSQGIPVTIDRSGAASIRACATEFGGLYTAVCYNQTTDLNVGRLTRSTERVVRVDCRTRIAYPEGSVRGAVSKEFCPQVFDGSLDPAPFLL
jgi:hypothetical protein